jgi:hypothetical protein
MYRLIFLALLVAVPLLVLGSQPASACWGWGSAGYGYSSYRPAYRYVTPIDPAMLMLWLAWLGVASWVAPVVVAVE